MLLKTGHAGNDKDKYFDLNPDKEFKNLYEAVNYIIKNMIITRTPFRVSFAGGGSDLKEYYLKYGGSVLSVSIDKYIYLSMHPYFNNDKIFFKVFQK